MKKLKYRIDINKLYKDNISKNCSLKEYYFKPLKTGSYEFICVSTFELNSEIYNLRTNEIVNSAYQKNRKKLRLASTLLEGNIYCIKIYNSEIMKIDEKIEYLFELNFVCLPSNLYFEYQWGIFNSKSGIDINILPVWKYIYNIDIKVGIVDSGIVYNHPCLVKNINLKLSYNFLSENNSSYSSAEEESFQKNHGTFIAGIIASQPKNKIGVIGISNNKNIISLKIFGKNSNQKTKFNKTSDNFISAIKYAIKNEIKILNCSFNGKNINHKERKIMEKAKNILFVVSAGNEGINLNRKKIYPACYNLENIIVVGAINKYGELYPTSNYGDTVDIVAPGEDIVSTYADNDYIKASGPSGAAPFVTGVCSLILSKFPTLSPNELKNIITSSENITKIDKLNGKIKTGGMINAYKSLFSI